MSRTRIYQLIALAIPVLFFALLEIGLRVFDYGKVMPLFMEYPAKQDSNAPTYLLPRPDVVKRYFPVDSIAPTVTIETNFFLKDKPKDGLRIVVQGGSTAAGFPFGYGASIAGMLDYRLKESFPDRTVEVINTALAAVNSYTVLDFVDEIIEQKPDAILIYAGHNEYLGILGVGSAYTAANSQSATLLHLKLKEFRIYQLLQNLYWHLTKTSTAQSTASDTKRKSRTFMAKVAKHKNIPYGSKMYQAGLQQFSNNLSMVIEKYQAAGIPVFISSIASNLADQAPFSSNDTTTNDATKERNANYNYQLGKKLLVEAQYLKAKQSFVKARDYDLLRFRAPSAINDIIVELSEKQSVYFVDSNKALTKAAKHGVIGKSLMLEHLHPTIKGYFIIADSFYLALKTSNLFGKFPKNITTEMAEDDIPVFDAEIYWGKAKIAALKADYPFVKAPKKVVLPVAKTPSDRLGLAAYRKQIGWLDLARENLKYARDHDIPLYIKSVKLIADAMPFEANPNYRAGVVLIRQEKYSQAPRYLKRAIAINPTNINYQLALSHAYLEQGKLQQALPWLESVLRIAPKNITANKVIVQVKQYLSR